MTHEQRKLAEDNHNLIYGFLNKHELSIEEYYDVAAIGLCKAAISYDSSITQFATYAYTVMYNEIKVCYRRQQASIRVPTHLIDYYDAPIHTEGTHELTLLDVIPSHECLEDTILNCECIKKFVGTLSEQEKKLVMLVYNECTQTEMAATLGLSQSYVSRMLRKLKKAYVASIQ